MPILDPTEELRKMQFQHYHDTAEKFGRSVKPVLGDGEDGNPVMLGSGILLTVDGAYYLVSAAHVFDKAKGSKIYTSADSNGQHLIPISLNGFYSPPDKFDFAVCDLDEEQVKALGAENFIIEDLISVTGESSEHHCMGLGFPTSRNKISVSRKTIDGRLYRYITKSIRKEENFSFFIYDDVLHNKEKMVFDKPLDPDGISGGMLIDVGPLSGWENVVKTGHDKIIKAKILGMIIEKNPIKKENRAPLEIKAVDIKLIRDAIRHKNIK
jgi:hypothetical protein